MYVDDDGAWTGSGTHPITRACAAITEALDAVADLDPMFLAEQAQRDALLSLTRSGTRLEAVRMRVMQAVATPGGAAEAEGARSAASWLNSRARTGFGAARAAEKLGQALACRWRLVAAALEDGSVNLPQARVIVKALDNLVIDPLPGEEVPAEILARAEAFLVEKAAEFGPHDLERLGTTILEKVAPQTCDARERRLLERAERRANAATRLTLHKRGDGSTDLRARIPDHAAARLKTYLEAWTSPRQDDSTASGAATRLGAFGQRDTATGERLPQERLRGLAFVAFLEAADPARMPRHGGAATKVLVTIALKDLMEGIGAATIISNGEETTTISVGQARRLMCQAGLAPAVLGTDSVPLDMGRDSRLFKPWQRDARTLTQPDCGAEGCTVPSTWCEAHHRRDPWAAGGTSDLDDLFFLCSWHHHRAHDPAYATETMPNGDVRFRRRT